MIQDVKIGEYHAVLCSLPESGVHFGNKYAKAGTFYVIVTDSLGELITNKGFPVLKATHIEVARRQFMLRQTYLLKVVSNRGGTLMRNVPIKVGPNASTKETRNVLFKNQVDFGDCS